MQTNAAGLHVHAGFRIRDTTLSHIHLSFHMATHSCYRADDPTRLVSVSSVTFGICNLFHHVSVGKSFTDSGAFSFITKSNKKFKFKSIKETLTSSILFFLNNIRKHSYY